MRFLAAVAIALTLTSCSGQVDLGRIIQQVRPVAESPAAGSATASPAEAVKQVIERANIAQQKAFASGNTSLLRDTSTTAYFDEVAQTNVDLAKSGVTSFQLVRLEWGDVTIDGTTAHATSYETWRTTYTDGATDERTDRNEYTLVLEGSAWKIESDVQPDAHIIAPSGGAVPGQQSTTPAQISSTSSNWSGYAATGGSFASVTAAWTVPQVSAAKAGADATWVGIGGVAGTDLIQAGTQAVVTGGAVEYTAWTETLPQSSRTVPLRVNAGDSVTVTITESSPAQWLVVLVNNTTKEKYQTTLQYSSSHSSAEWIQEAPSAGRGVVPLDDFGTVRFTGATAVRDGKSMTLGALNGKAVAMINGSRQELATPSGLDTSGSGFSVTRTQAPSTGSGGSRRRRG